jgi:hypothetical protein
MTTDGTDKTTVKTVPIGDLVQDSNNANRGTPRGRKTLKGSLKKFGAGRSILLDKDNTVLAGNKTLEEAKKQGFKKVLVIDTDGDTLVAVRRTDLDAKDKKAQELAIADNRVGELDLAWDPEVLKQTEADLSELFEPLELDRLLNDGKNTRRADTIDLQPPPKMLWVLLGIPFNRFDVVQDHFAALEAEAEISVQSARNE